MNTGSGMDKRRDERHKVRVPMRYRETTARPAAFRHVEARDAGLGGLRFLSEDFLAIDTSLVLELRLEEGSKPVRAVSRVAWSRIQASGHRYEIGTAFLEVSPSDRHTLWCFLAPRNRRG